MMARKQECCSCPKFCLAVLSLILLMRLSYGFNLGTNMTLDFHHELSSQDSSYFCLVSIKDTPEPFFHHNQFNPGGLRPGQAGRIDLLKEQSQRNLTIHIMVQDLQRIDEGLYIVDIIETIDGTPTPHFYESYVNVTYPPEQAKCQIKNPPLPTQNWLVVSCNATLGNDDSGYILCFQDSKQTPYFQPAKNIRHIVTADFWMEPTRQIQCCSSDAPDTDLDSCNDFVYTPASLPPDDIISSDKPDYITTTAWPPHSSSKADAGSPPNHGNTSQLYVILILLAVAAILVAAVIFVLRERRFRASKNQDTRTTAERTEYRECDQVEDHKLQKPV